MATEAEKDIFKEIHDTFMGIQGGTGSQFGSYTKQMQGYGHIPLNQFDHQWGLIHSNKRAVAEEEFNFLEDQNKYLGNVADAKVLRFYQIDNFFLTHMFAMGEADVAERLVFQVCWANFKSELRMTCNIGGEERKLQSGLPLSGGAIMGKSRGFLGRGRKKQKTVEYVTPSQEQEEGSTY